MTAFSKPRFRPLAFGAAALFAGVLLWQIAAAVMPVSLSPPGACAAAGADIVSGADEPSERGGKRRRCRRGPRTQPTHDRKPTRSMRAPPAWCLPRRPIARASPSPSSATAPAGRKPAKSTSPPPSMNSTNSAPTSSSPSAISCRATRVGCGLRAPGRGIPRRSRSAGDALVSLCRKPRRHARHARSQRPPLRAALSKVFRAALLLAGLRRPAFHRAIFRGAISVAPADLGRPTGLAEQ